MKRTLICLSVGVAFILWLPFRGSDPRAKTGPKGCPAGIQRDALEEELDRAASSAIAAIKSGEPEKLMPLLAAKGVVLGVDGPLVRLSSIREQMSARTGIYCVIFDSSCLRKEVNESRKKAGATSGDEEIISFRDLVLRSHAVMKTALADAPSFCGGTTSDGSPFFVLDWQRTSKGWKIVAIPYL